MYQKMIAEINEGIKQTKKVIISLGCSFVEGQGAIDQDLYDTLNWTMERTGVPMEPVIDKQKKKELLEKYPELTLDFDKKIRWEGMEYKNSFVNVLCKKYFNGQYTPINFGLRGKGNRASIKSLYFWPQINWHEVEEFVVIYVPSGQERFDFLSDEFRDSSQFICMWPWYDDKPEGPRRTLWKGYHDALYSWKSAALEQISNVLELKNWCENRNAKLIIVPGFDRTYNRESMLRILNDYTIRDENQNIKMQVLRSNKNTESLFKDNYPQGHLNHLEMIVDQWPWDKMFKPQGCETFIELCLKQEGITNKGFWDYNGIGTPDHWVTVCCHPSAKGHDLFAKELFQHIKDIK